MKGQRVIGWDCNYAQVNGEVGQHQLMMSCIHIMINNNPDHECIVLWSNLPIERSKDIQSNLLDL